MGYLITKIKNFAAMLAEAESSKTGMDPITKIEPNLSIGHAYSIQLENIYKKLSSLISYAENKSMNTVFLFYREIVGTAGFNRINRSNKNWLLARSRISMQRH